MATPPTPTAKGQLHLHPMLIVLAMLITTMVLTYLIPAGNYDHNANGHIIADSYHVVAKDNGITALLSGTIPDSNAPVACAAGVIALFASVPAGMMKASSLIIMLLFVGGAFGTLKATGVIDAGADRLLDLTSGNVYLLAAGLLILLSCGSTFLGFSSEYVAIIPLVVQLGRRLQLPDLFAPGVVATADFIGYTASVTNPVSLGVAQPLAGVPIFSGALPRLAVFVVLLSIGLVYLSLYLKRQPKIAHISEASSLSGRHICVLATLFLAGLGLIAGTALWSWHTSELTSAFLALSILLAIAGGLAPTIAADACLDGMKAMLLPAVLIGLAGGIGFLLETSQILDTIVFWITDLLHSHDPGLLATGLMSAEMLFGILIPSVSAKAAVSMPIMVPIAHLSGVSGQVTVNALLFGSGMTNMISPTNPLLLAFLAAARVDYGDWVKFIAPLFLVFCAVTFFAIYWMASLGF